MFEVSKKTFTITALVVLGICLLGTTPASKKVESTPWEKPKAGPWCLGFDHKNNQYRYDTSSKQQPAKKVIRKSHHSFELHENGNFTKEQAKDLEEYLQSHPNTTPELDIEDILDNIEYYID